MKKSKDGFLTRTVGRVRRRRDDCAKKTDGEKSGVPAKNIPWQLAPLGLSLVVASAVFMILRFCESRAYVLPLFRSSWCEPWTQNLEFFSISAGVGFLVFLAVEVLMIFAQMWSDKQVEAAERRAEIAENQARSAEQARREEVERAERAERRMEEYREEFKLREQEYRKDREADREERQALLELIRAFKKDGDAD